MSKRHYPTLVLAALLVLALAAALVSYRDARRQETAATLAADELAALRNRPDLSRRLATADSTVDVLRARLRTQSVELDTLRPLAVRNAERPLSTLSAPPPAASPAPLSRSRPSQYDSLTFALRKSELRVRQLTNQLRTRSSGYLALESEQGNTIYYVGDVLRGRAHGRGVAIYSTGSRYVGQWRDNERHGHGEFFWTDGAHYAGDYRHNHRDGRGTYHFPGGEVYDGEWAEDARNGSGVLYDKKGKVVVRGEWVDDELQ